MCVSPDYEVKHMSHTQYILHECYVVIMDIKH